MPRVLSSTLPTLPHDAHPRAVVGGAQVLAASREIADAATASLYVDTFRPTREQNLAAFAAAAARGAEVHLQLDSESLDAPRTPNGSRDALSAVGTIIEYGANPYKQHGKAISRDATEAMVASDVSDVKSEPRMEFGVRFSGAAVEALQAVQALAPHDSRATATAVIDAAAAQGIVVNDPRHGERRVSDALASLVAESSDELYVATKAFDSGSLAKDLARAAARGVPTTVVTEDMPDRQRRRLREAGVVVHVVDGDEALEHHTALHGTIVATGGTTLLTSMPLIKRAIVGSDGRQSRELGVVVDGAASVALTREVRARLGE